MPSVPTGSGGWCRHCSEKILGCKHEKPGEWQGAQCRYRSGYQTLWPVECFFGGVVLLGPYQTQEALGSGRQQLVEVNAQYMQATCRIQTARASDLEEFQLDGCQAVLNPFSKPL